MLAATAVLGGGGWNNPAISAPAASQAPLVFTGGVCGGYYLPVGPQSTQSTCYKIYTSLSSLKWEEREVRRRRRWVMLVDATKFKCLMGQTHTHTHTLWHPDKQRPQSLADLTYRVIKTPLMHFFLSSSLIPVPLTSVSISFQSLRLFTLSLSLWLSIDISLSLHLSSWHYLPRKH